MASCRTSDDIGARARRRRNGAPPEETTRRRRRRRRRREWGRRARRRPDPSEMMLRAAPHRRPGPLSGFCVRVSSTQTEAPSVARGALSVFVVCGSGRLRAHGAPAHDAMTHAGVSWAVRRHLAGARPAALVRAYYVKMHPHWWAGHGAAGDAERRRARSGRHAGVTVSGVWRSPAWTAGARRTCPHAFAGARRGVR